jgi:hypothetical protein
MLLPPRTRGSTMLTVGAAPLNPLDPLEELPAVWRAQAGSPHVKYVVLPQDTQESER